MRLRYLLSLFVLCLVASCGDDDGPSPAQKGNANANDWTIPYATRLEMPRLRAGLKDIFLVHTCAGYDVNYAVEWNTDKKAQRWSAYMMCDQNNVSKWNRNNWKYGTPFTWQGQTWPNEWKSEPFMEDPDLPAGTCATLDMHRSNGYDRGHIVPSADRLMSMEANGQTYFLSNMHPQLASFNQNGGLWYNMENMVRKWNDKKIREGSRQVSWRDTLWVVKGGLIENVGTNANNGDCFLLANRQNLVVPNYFFVAVLAKKHGDTTQGGYAAMGFFFKHTDGQGADLHNYAYSIDQLEARTGIDFFCNLPDDIENQVERNYVPSVWDLKDNSHNNIPY